MDTVSGYYSGSGYGGLSFDLGSGSSSYTPTFSGYNFSTPTSTDWNTALSSPSFSSLTLDNSGLDSFSFNPLTADPAMTLTADLGSFSNQDTPGFDFSTVLQALPLTDTQSAVTGLPVINWDSALASSLPITPTYPQALPLTFAQSQKSGLPITEWNNLLLNTGSTLAPVFNPLPLATGPTIGNINTTHFGYYNDPSVYQVQRNSAGQVVVDSQGQAIPVVDSSGNEIPVDRNTAAGIGSADNPLTPQALALSPILRQALGAQNGDVLLLQDASGNVEYGYVADKTSASLSDYRVDIYDPTGSSGQGVPFNAVNVTNLGGGSNGLSGNAIYQTGLANIARFQDRILVAGR